MPTSSTALGSTLSNDQLSDKRFDFPFVNPPYGYEWNKDYDAVTMAGFLPSNGSMSPNQSGEGDIRRCVAK